MASDESQAYKHPLPRENLVALKALQAEGQTVGARGHHTQMTGFFTWGFIIYRCDYSDDALFERLMAYLQDQAEDYVDDPATDLPAIEGCTDKDVGWAYVAADDWVELYEELYSDQVWYVLYKRPPGIIKV